jgi:hypothetical protein
MIGRINLRSIDKQLKQRFQLCILLYDSHLPGLHSSTLAGNNSAWRYEKFVNIGDRRNVAAKCAKCDGPSVGECDGFLSYLPACGSTCHCFATSCRCPNSATSCHPRCSARYAGQPHWDLQQQQQQQQQQQEWLRQWPAFHACLLLASLTCNLACDSVPQKLANSLQSTVQCTGSWLRQSLFQTPLAFMRSVCYT